MRVSEVREPGELERLRPVWNQLLDASGSGTTFLTWEWITAWWSAYGNATGLCVLTAVDESGIVRGIAPLRRDTARRYGHAFPTLAFIGDGSNDSDYLDFIIAKGFEEPVLAAWLQHIDTKLERGLILRLSEIPAGSSTLPLLEQLTAGRLYDQQPVACATVSLPMDWESYLATLRPRFRTRIRSVLRHLEGRPDVRFGFCDHTSQLERLLPALFDLHTRRWNHDGRPGVFGWDRKRQFYHALSPLLLERGVLRFSWLEWNGRILACQYGFTHGNTYLHLQEGYEPAAEHWNIGVGLRAWTIREFLGAGIREYDFLAGVGRHKSDWGAQLKESRSVAVAVPTYKNLLYFRAPVWERLAKDGAMRVLPEKLLARRRERLERRVAPPPHLPDSGKSLRQAAARWYLRLGIPAVSQHVRKRYQVSVAANGRLPRVSWTKRRQPAGRIFCYHRVNDERDPFFPAMPVEVFESHMRFVARRYRVVSLGDLIAHLEGESPETVVAVTFDDGYRDNYENALPILERYDLPATVFLTTGSLDSQEPLWFEQLAEALKTSAREYLDLETDLPRRFWMRSADERLRARSALFTLLRHLPDEERRNRLNTILHQLAAPESSVRRDMMLTWDQVRYMKQRRIDFGGHTVTHPFLSKVGSERLHWEIAECKRRIETELQTQVAHFAYPNGRDEDFATWNKEAIRAAGYQTAVTTLWGLNYSTTDRLELRRSGPWEEDEALFACKMDWYELVNG